MECKLVIMYRLTLCVSIHVGGSRVASTKKQVEGIHDVVRKKRKFNITTMD